MYSKLNIWFMLLVFHLMVMNEDSSIDEAIDYGLDDDLNFHQDQEYFLHHHVQTGSLAHSTLYTIGTPNGGCVSARP
jgi:hypothetical protein